MMFLGLLMPILIGVAIYLIVHGTSEQPHGATRALPRGTGSVAAGPAMRVAGSFPSSSTDAPARAPVAARVNELMPARTDDLARWQAAGLLTEAQVQAILEHERTRIMFAPPSVVAPTVGRRLPSAAEALGYLGGLLAIVGMVLLVGRYWEDIPLAGRLGLSGGLALALFAAGWFVSEDGEPALRRMKWFVWLLSSAATAVFGGVLAWEWYPDSVKIPLAGAIAVALHDSALWWRRERPLQQSTFLVATAVAAGTATSLVASRGTAGLAVWVTGAVMVVLALRRVVPLSVLTLFVGAVTAVVGAVVTSSDWQAFGLLFLTATAAALLALAAIPGPVSDRAHQRLLTIVGAVALFQALPGTIGYFAEQAGAATGTAVWLIGAGLVVIGGRTLIRKPHAATLIGGIALVGGAALTGTQWERVGPLFGIATAIALLALGMLPGRVLLSLAGCLGLLISVPWAIVAWFPGDGRAPLLILVSGALIVAVAAFLARSGDRFRQLGGDRPEPPPADVN